MSATDDCGAQQINKQLSMPLASGKIFVLILITLWFANKGVGPPK